MTITYSLDVANASFCGIHKLLLRWKGSIWKSIWPELAGWLTVYLGLSFSYRLLMNKTQQMLFEDLCVFFNAYSDYIPITFMLGFYVSAVFGRWNEIFMNLGWIDSCAILLSTVVRGSTEEARNIRRNIVRYLVLVQAMVYRDISAGVKKRFPTMDHVVTAGIMTANELREFDAIETEHIKYWTPIQWAFLLLRRARDQGLIDSDFIYVDMMEKIRQYRVNVLTLTLYDWVPIPLVYTQVVNLAVRVYFLIALFGRQFLVGERDLPGKSNIDLVVPVMTILQFLFYMGWIKVAEVLLNPLGEDDDDFECNYIIDRNLQVGLCIVDDCYGRVPSLERDQFWEESNPQLLYTPESAQRAQNPMMGSCNDVQQQEDMLLLQPRKRRLMSTATGPTAFTNRGYEDGEEGPQSAAPAEDNIVPVPNHNPRLRVSVVHNAYADSSNKLFDTMRRKLSRSPNAHNRRRGSTESSGQGRGFERGHTARVSSNSVSSTGSGSVQHFLWGGGKPPNGHAHVHFEVATSDAERAETNSGANKTLPVIEEEAASEGGQKCSTSNTSVESVSSTSSSEKGASNVQQKRY